MSSRFLLPALASLMLYGCAEPNMNTETVPTPEPVSLGKSSTVSLKGHDGTFVACELALDGEDKAILVSSRTTAGDWETFTMYEKPDGKVAFQAPNGKFICSDELKGGILVADRDQVGDWESFTLVPQDSGKVALQTRNGSFVTADYGLTGNRRGALFGNRQQVKEWELFTIVKDSVTVQ